MRSELARQDSSSKMSLKLSCQCFWLILKLPVIETCLEFNAPGQRNIVMTEFLLEGGVVEEICRVEGVLLLTHRSLLNRWHLLDIGCPEGR